MQYNFNICEFFAGVGGSHLGFLSNGFKSVYVNDIDDEMLKTLTFNNPELQNTIVDNSSITDIDPQNLKDKLKQNNVNDIDVIFGGIVCKGFSLAGERSPNDSRNHFYEYYLNIVKELQPKVSIIENVKGLLTAQILPLNTPKNILEKVDNLWQELENFKGKKSELRKKNLITEEFEKYGIDLRKKKKLLLQEISIYTKKVIDDIVKIYNEIGYNVEYKVLNSAWYGSSTKRERLIIVATRKDLKGKFEFPFPEYNDISINTKMDFKICNNEINLNFKSPITIREALNKINYEDSNDVDNIPMKHNLKTIERFKYIKEGENIQSNMENVPDSLKISKFYSRGNTMRLKFDGLAPTLVPGHSNFPIHPVEHRSITVREAATITGFPLNYKFFGSHSKRCEQVGNAVPPPLSYAIAKSVKDFLINQNT